MRTVLIVDDKSVIRKTMEAFITRTHPNAVIIHAEDGAEGWEVINAPGRKVDIVVSDVDMPVMDGVKLTEKIRQEHPDIHVILMSGNPEPKKHGAHVFMQKPIDRKAFLAKIEKLMLAKKTQ